MTHYNKLSEVSYSPKITSWRFRVKIHRIYPFYSYVTSSGSFYKYVLADEEGTKMEMTIYGNSDRFRGLEKQEGKWVEIFRVEVNRSYPDTMGVVFNTEAHFDDSASPRMVFYIRDNIIDTPIIPAILVLIGFGDELGDAHPAPTLTRYSRSSYSSPTTGRGR
ncbi:hypothetical protein F2Q68_00038808 [Brassica cretica]|uniref:Replication protein A 70 kDa DNA-binding subunit B/D first OB fold domain-containing protein n=1 Tax=Brassica cretica TaxID=69181 RepID=A0A8S9MKF5_BRACR|nr:hypothetical protein F2Q68_00038808 [Brassica cretica]